MPTSGGKRRGKITTEVKIIGLNREFALLKPQNGELYAYDPSIGEDFQQIKAQGQSVPEIDEIRWILNGREIQRQKVSDYQRPTVFLPISSIGDMKLEMLGLNNGKIIKNDQVRFKVRD